MPKYINNYVNQKRTDFTLDTEDEVAGLPTHAKNNLGFHSIAYVLGAGKAYFLEEKSDTWKLMACGGGGGGTGDYNDLTNKPTIEGKTLEGDMTLDDIGDEPISDADILAAIEEAFG